GIRRSALKLDAIFHPSLTIPAVGRKCKVRMGDLETITEVLNAQRYFDAVPELYPQRMHQELEEISDRFSEFSGEEGWKIQASHVASFISQFPPKMRSEVTALLRDKNRFLFLNRTETNDLVLEGLSKLELPKPF